MRDETRISRSRSRLVLFLRNETRTRRVSSKQDENEKSYFSSRSRYFSFSYENFSFFFSFSSRFLRGENEKNLQEARREREELFLVSFSSRRNTRDFSAFNTYVNRSLGLCFNLSSKKALKALKLSTSLEI